MTQDAFRVQVLYSEERYPKHSYFDDKTSWIQSPSHFLLVEIAIWQAMSKGKLRIHFIDIKITIVKKYLYNYYYNIIYILYLYIITIMILFISPIKAQRELAENMRSRRLAKGLTQEGLAERSGVSLPTLRKFEQTGKMSLESFLKLALVLDCLEGLLEVTTVTKEQYASIDDVLKSKKKVERKRGWRK